MSGSEIYFRLRKDHSEIVNELPKLSENFCPSTSSKGIL